MSACTYCQNEVVWVPTLEGFRPFQTPVPVSPEATVVVLDRHDCEERRQALKGAQEAFARHLVHDPVIREHARWLDCPRCEAGPGQACFDLRTPTPGKTNKNPHQPRLIAGVRAMQS